MADHEQDQPAYIDMTVALDRIVPSTTNPRRTYDEKKLAELAESIRQVGVMSPIVVRPFADGDRYEVIFGERRRRASKLAGLGAIPVRVCELEDVEVLVAQLTENDQREEVHPLEEAEAYRKLHEEHHLPIKEIARRIGRSTEHVSQRMRLCSLRTAARAYFQAGQLSYATALLVARIRDEKMQNQAAKEIVDGPLGQPMPAEMAADHVQRRYMLRLAEAPFDTAALDLVPGCGACGPCPKRAGNAPDLFPDVKVGDTCTDPACYAEKSIAGWKVRLKQAKADSVRVLSEIEAKKAFPYVGDAGKLASTEWVDLDAKCESDPKRRTYRQLLGPAPEGRALARDSGGKVHDLFPNKDLKRALRDAGHDFRAQPTSPRSGAAETPERKSKLDRDLEAVDKRAGARVRDALIASVVEIVEHREPRPDEWRALLAKVTGAAFDLGDLAKRRGYVSDVVDAEREVEKRAQKMTAAQLRGLFVEAVALQVGDLDEIDADMKAVVRAFKVDEKDVVRQVREQATTEKKAIRDAARAAEEEKAAAARKARREATR